MTMTRTLKQHKPRQVGRKTARLNSTQRGYGSRWQRARLDYLAANPWCRSCNVPATVVDHVKPHKGDRRLFWDRDNWQPLCKRCHDRKTATEDGGFGR